MKLKSLSWPVLMLVAACWLGSPVAVSSQDSTTYTAGPFTNACIMSIYKYWKPNRTNPSQTVYIAKRLDMARACSTLVPGMNAFCNPGSLAPHPTNTMVLAGSAFNSDITMNPTCSWTCTGCGAIPISAASDGLPVELMDFSVEDDVAAVGGEEAGDDAGERASR